MLTLSNETVLGLNDFTKEGSVFLPTSEGGFVLFREQAIEMISTSRNAITVTRLDADKNVVTQPVEISNPAEESRANVFATPLSDGSFAVGWSLLADSATGFAKVVARIVDKNGVPSSDIFQLDSSERASETPAITELGNGNILGLWKEDIPQNGSFTGDQVVGRIFTKSGSPVESEFRVDGFGLEPGAFYKNDIGAIPLANGSALVSWNSNGQDGAFSGIYAQVFSPTGQHVGTEFRVNQTVSGDQSDVSITQIANGNLVATWQSGGGFSWDIYARIFDTFGRAITDEFRVNTYLPERQLTPEIVALDDGGFIVGYYSLGNRDGKQDGNYLQQFSANGDKVGFEIRTSTLNDKVARIDFAIGSDGDPTLFYSENSSRGGASGTAPNTFSRDIDPAESSVTTGDDIYFLRLPGTLDGLSGDDILFGANISEVGDTILGNTGKDELGGYAGNDTLNGGADTDTVDYSKDLGSFGVTVNLAAGTAEDTHGDTDTLISIERVIGTDDTDILYGSNDYAVELHGQEGDDEVWGYFATGDDLNGGDGVDLVAALGGSSTLTGGGAMDFMLTSYGSNTIDAGSGNDQVFVRYGENTVDLGSGFNLLISMDLYEAAEGEYFADSNDSVTGGVLDDYIYSGRGEDTLSGGGGNDWLAGGEWNDTLTGGTGFDRFIFSDETGFDIITDFTDGEDYLDFTTSSLVSSFNDLFIAQVGDDLALSWNGGASGVTLEGFDLADFSSADMLVL